MAAAYEEATKNTSMYKTHKETQISPVYLLPDPNESPVFRRNEQRFKTLECKSRNNQRIN